MSDATPSGAELPPISCYTAEIADALDLVERATATVQGALEALRADAGDKGRERVLSALATALAATEAAVNDAWSELAATGATEFEYNRSLARAALAGLRNAGFTATFLIGDSGSPLRLQERTSIARTNGASLFISLHHDSVQPRYLSVWTFGGKPQSFSNVFHGYSLFVSKKNTHFAASEMFAELLGHALHDQGLTPSLHHAEKIPGEGRPLLDPRLGLYQFDDLVVLRTAAMPALLLESAIIVNRDEEQRVRSGERHIRVTAALVSAVGEYCQTRLGQ